jgi:signal peptidase I
VWRHTPARFGDLVLCPEPEAEGRIVIARIAGENGDHVSVKGSTVSVNGKRAATERACAQFSVSDPNTDKDVKQHCQIEVLGSVAHMRGSADGHKQQPLDVARDVPDGSIFLLSDNRLYPFDSRDYGSVERATCQESIVFRLVSSEGFFDVDNRFTFIQ